MHPTHMNTGDEFLAIYIVTTTAQHITTLGYVLQLPRVAYEGIYVSASIGMCK